MPQRNGKSSFPHEPSPDRLPSQHRFGMLSAGGAVAKGCHNAMLPPMGGEQRVAYAVSSLASSLAHSSVAHQGLTRRVLAVLAFTHARRHRDNRVRRSPFSGAPARASASINIGALTLTLLLTGCTIGPNYSRE